MVDFFNYLYRFSCGRNVLLSRLRVYSVLRLTVRCSANFVIPLWFRLKKTRAKNTWNASQRFEGRKVVVSLTSFPARISRTWLVVESLLRQTCRADVVVLWLSKEQFPTLETVPNSLLRLQSEGLRIELCDDDLRSHKKHFYALQDFGESMLILADDDIYYPSFMIESLLLAGASNPGKVIARFTKRMIWDANGLLRPYLDWPKVNDGILGRDYFFGSGGGVLIPPGSVNSDVMSANVFTSICPYADDVWLNAMCRVVSRDVFSLEEPFILLPVVNEDPQDLSTINNGQSMNDLQISAVRNYCDEKHRVDPFRAIKLDGAS